MANTPRVRHHNTGSCLKCIEIRDRYPDFHSGLWSWFAALQAQHSDAHISDAGRGRDRQERYYRAGASKAAYGQSAHNYNAALDIFWLVDGVANYDRKRYQEKLSPMLEPWIVWYGAPGSKFPERPHVEVRGWRYMAERGDLRLVE
jgi:hypothetical protein